MQIFLGASSFGGWLWFALVTLDFFTPGVIRVGIAGHIVPKAFKKKTKLKKKTNCWTHSPQSFRV